MRGGLRKYLDWRKECLETLRIETDALGKGKWMLSPVLRELSCLPWIVNNCIYKDAYNEEDSMERRNAQLIIDKFNKIAPVGTNVFYFKSDIEGRQKSKVTKEAYVQGDSTPVVILDGIGIALIDKVELA